MSLAVRGAGVRLAAAAALLLAACEVHDLGPDCATGPLEPRLVGDWRVAAGPDPFWVGGAMGFGDDGSFTRVHPTAQVISTGGCWRVTAPGQLLFATQRLQVIGYVDAEVAATYSLAADTLTIVEAAGWWGPETTWTLTRDDIRQD